MIKNRYSVLLFDLGNVVFGTDNDNSVRFWADLKGIEQDLLRKRLLNDKRHGLFEKGLISSRDYHQHLVNILEIDFTFEEFVEGWNLVYREAFLDVKAEIRRLSNNYTIVAFTNTNEIHNEIWPNRYKDVLKYFDHIFVSSEMKLRKPEIDAFNYVMNKLSASPNEILFFDDREENIKAARSLGIDSVLVHNSSNVSSKLKELSKLDFI